MTFRRILAGIGFLLVLAGGYLVFELGRYQAGFAVLEADRDRRLLAEQARKIESLERELAIHATSRDIDRETYARVEATLVELEARLQAQEEELAFYRGIISPPEGVPGLRVQSLEVAPARAERGYTLRVVLMQAIAENRRVEGVVRLLVVGSRGEKLALSEIATAEDVTELEYDFRYFQGLEQEIALPAGFEPAAVEVEVRPSSPRGDPVTQTFDWPTADGPAGEG